MRSFGLFLPGNFEDAYIYMGRLLILTAERSLRFYDIEKIVGGIEEQMPQFQPLFTYLFTRNDWLASTQFKSLLKNHEFLNTFLSIFHQASKEPYFEIKENPKHLQFEFELGIPANVLLDMAVYNQRLYFGADTGLYHLDAVMESEYVQVPNAPVKRHDGRSMNTSAGYGSINVSCGNDGLFSGFDEFGWITKDGKRPLSRTAEKSVRTAWSGQDLINYLTATTPILLTGVHEKSTSKGLETEKTVLTNIGAEKIDLDYLFEKIFAVEMEELASIRYIYNSNNVFFIYTTQGDLFTIGVGKRGQDITVQYTRVHKNEQANTRILSMHPTNVGLVLETDDQILLFANGNFLPIINSSVLSVRTFMRSKRYKNIVAITREDGVLVTSFFEENVYIDEE